MARKPSGLNPPVHTETHTATRKTSGASAQPPQFTEDVVALRTAIYQLRKKKELSKADQALLAKMTARLKELSGAE